MAKFNSSGVLALVAACVVAPAHAQTTAYPAKTIRIVCPAAPGGISDLLSRIVAQRLTPEAAVKRNAVKTAKWTRVIKAAGIRVD